MYMHAKCFVTRHLQSVKQPPLCLKVGSTPSRQTLPAVAACGASSRSCGAHAAGNALTMARHQWAVVQHTLEHLPSFGLSSQTLPHSSYHHIDNNVKQQHKRLSAFHWPHQRARDFQQVNTQPA